MTEQYLLIIDKLQKRLLAATKILEYYADSEQYHENKYAITNLITDYDSGFRARQVLEYLSDGAAVVTFIDVDKREITLKRIKEEDNEEQTKKAD